MAAGAAWEHGSMSRTVLIVDDHAAFRARARALLHDDGFDVVGEAGDGEAAVEAARRLRPQIVLLDVRLPGIDGFEVAERLAAGPEPPAVVLISSRGASTYRQRLRGSPATGFIAKAELSGERLSSLLA
jgi:DNA-binding NarL/FixJ family response regulator